MTKISFPGKWINLILNCISLVGFNFVINGKVSGRISPSKGLRQGCPLSPYLFILCGHALLSLISGAEQDGKVLGFRCCIGNPLISHLSFVDDSIGFCKVTPQSCSILKETLLVYSKGSGQQINF
ncbi:hypothetical protein ACOSQ2_011000 [Xanthoceras sorbifolium]